MSATNPVRSPESGVRSPAAAVPSSAVALVLRDGRVWAERAGEDAVPVRLVRARPVTEPEGAIAALDEQKREVALWPDLAALPAESQAVAREALAQRYLLPRILRITGARPWGGSSWWDVETDRGQRRFVLKGINKSVQHLDGGRIVIRDVLGNRYEIAAVAALDARSRLLLDRVL